MRGREELQDWCDKHDRKQMGSKALRVYNKCMLRGKVDIAKRIKQKYKRQFPQSDIAVALGMALLAAKNER